MLAEIKGARQIPGEGFRRWFTDDDLDLIVWYEEGSAALGVLKGFQLCYDKTGRERALTWTQEHGFHHNRIDAGEVPGHVKMTPVIIADGEFSNEVVAESFLKASGQLEPELARFVYSMLKGYPRGG